MDEVYGRRVCELGVENSELGVQKARAVPNPGIKVRTSDPIFSSSGRKFQLLTGCFRDPSRNANF